MDANLHQKGHGQDRMTHSLSFGTLWLLALSISYIFENDGFLSVDDELPPRGLVDVTWPFYNSWTPV